MCAYPHKKSESTCSTSSSGRIDGAQLEPFSWQAEDNEFHDLTLREKEVLRWITEAKSDAEIAVILGISTRTVNHHVANILRKVGVENRVAASRLALEAQYNEIAGRSQT